MLALNGRETPTKESLPTDIAIGTSGDDKEEDGADSAGGKALHDDKDLLRLPPKTGATSAGLDSVNGVKRIHLAAIYTYHRCRAVIRDISRRLQARGLLDASPTALRAQRAGGPIKA